MHQDIPRSGSPSTSSINISTASENASTFRSTSPGATAFQRRIYERLTEIPYGRIVSYGDIADEMGVAGAARAVGQAVGANPLPIVVPCHRVVRSDSRLGGYSGGLRLKVALLAIEGVGVDGYQSRSRVHPELLEFPL